MGHNKGADYVPPSTHPIHVTWMREKARVANGEDPTMDSIKALITEVNLHKRIELTENEIKELEKDSEFS